MSRVLRSLALLAGVTGLPLVTWYWPHVRNEVFVLLGNRNEGGGWYGFHSGFGGAYYITIPPALAILYWHHTCHAHPWCLRWGKFEAAGGMFRLCHVHHPDTGGERPELERITRLHREHQERTGRKP